MSYQILLRLPIWAFLCIGFTWGSVHRDRLVLRLQRRPTDRTRPTEAEKAQQVRHPTQNHVANRHKGKDVDDVEEVPDVQYAAGTGGGDLIVTHHKTGSVFARGFMECLSKNGLKRCKSIAQEDNSDIHWDGNVNSCDKITHIVRHPIDMIRSSYLYERQVPAVEDYLKTETVESMTDVSKLNTKPHPNELFYKYLNRAPERDGLIASMFGDAGRNVEGMEEAYAKSEGDNRVDHMCLEVVFNHFDTAKSRIFNFFHMGQSKSLETCVEHLDPQKTVTTHSTFDGLSWKDLDRITDTIIDIDKKLFDGRFSKSPVAMKCAMSMMDRVSEPAEDIPSWTEVMA